MVCRFHRKSWRRKSSGCSSVLLVESLSLHLNLLLIVLCFATFCSSFLQPVNGAIPDFKEFHFLIEPSSVVVADGKPVTFNCQVRYSGPEKFQIKWIRREDQKRLEDSSRRYMLSNGSLHFVSIINSQTGETDEGHYQCTATVPGIGTIVSKSAQLKVAYLPKHFDAEPRDLYLAPGDTAAFECLMNGEPRAAKIWYKGRHRLTPGPNMKVYPTGLLEIGSLSPSDYGTYACEAEVANKTRTSRMAALTQASANDPKLQGAPKHIITPHNERVVKGETVFLHCVAYGRDIEGRPPIISWLKGGTTIILGKNSTRFQVIGAGTLMISDVVESDAGGYTCRAVNLDDSVDAAATLTVLVRPLFTEKPQNKFAHTQSDVTLECEAQGNPRPVITWMRNGDVLKPSDYFKILSKGSLKILGLVNSDDGMYQCVAENELGDAQASAQLVVLSEGVPLPTTALSHPYPLPAGALYSESHSKTPSPTNLRVVVVATRFVIVSWTLPDHPGIKNVTSFTVIWRETASERERVSNTTLQEYNIQGLKPKTEYEIRVRAYNSQGPSQREAKITVVTKEEVLVPGPPVNLQARTVSSTSIVITWDAPQEHKDPLHKHKDLPEEHRVVVDYIVFFYKVGSKSEDEIRVNETSYTLKNLQHFRDYSFRVVAVNKNGPGVSTPEVLARTYSDIPSAAPQNFTLEVSSSTSLIIRWQPPPQDYQNGVITGYKIRRRRRGFREDGETLVTDGNRNTYALTDLRRGTEYQVRISAMTVNGSGPATSWESAVTYQDDLDESTVPPEPAHLIARPKANSIKVSWAPPPPHSKILVKGYVLGYGRGISDVFKHTLDANTHDYVIENLQPASQYVITIRAFNSQGQGPSKYETVITSEDTIEEPSTPMLPPVGLNAHVLSSSTIILTWADNSLSRNQKITDNRYYTIKYRPLNSKGSKYRFINATDLNYHIKGLRPNTEYEFMVRVIKARRESDFSMTVINKTEETAPGSEPRDVTPVPLEGNPFAVSLNWQPPAHPNGLITGYVIYYTNDLHAADMTWPFETVVGERLSMVIDKLTPDTRYHFRVLARNSKGVSIKSAPVTYVTPPSSKFQPGSHVTPQGGQTDSDDGRAEAGLTTNVIIIISACAAGFIFCTAVIIAIICLCKCRGNSAAHQIKTPTKVNKTPPPSVKPPDLWIHQPNNLELQKMERSQRSESSASVATSTLRRGSRGSADQTDDQASTIDRRRNSFVGDGGYPSSGEERYPPIQPRNLIRPKPVALPEAQPSFREPIATVTAAPNGHILQYGDSPGGPLPMRPIYPRTQYNTQYTSAARVNAGDLPHSCPPSMKPQQNISPYKKPTAPIMSAPNKGQRTPISFNSKSPEMKNKKDDADLSKSLSTEELTAEMANLEGLMKDLNAITQQEFEC